MQEINKLLSELLNQIDNIEDSGNRLDTALLSEIKNKLRIFNSKFFDKNGEFEMMIEEVSISRANYSEYILAKEQLRSVIVSMRQYIEFSNEEFEILSERKKELDQKIIDLEESNRKIEDRIQKSIKDAETIESIKITLDEQAEEITKQTSRLLSEEEKLNEFKAKLDIADKTVDFQSDAKQNKTTAQAWIILGVFLFICLLGLIIANLKEKYAFSDVANKINSEMIKQKLSSHFIENTIYITYAKIIFARLLLYSMLLYAIKICIKNYTSEMHNNIINSHKSNSLKSIHSIMSVAKTEDGNDKLLVQATQAIFEHQNTGYDKAQTTQTPNLINNVVESVTKKI